MMWKWYAFSRSQSQILIFPLLVWSSPTTLDSSNELQVPVSLTFRRANRQDSAVLCVAKLWCLVGEVCKMHINLGYFQFAVYLSRCNPIINPGASAFVNSYWSNGMLCLSCKTESSWNAGISLSYFIWSL
jgi:hypothetical protein